MEVHDDRMQGALADPRVRDEDLRDEAGTTRHRGWYAAVLVLDAIAILAFVVWVVLPRLT
jgi:hypothetical protein